MTFTPYDGRVRLRRHWWQFWVPKYDPNAWVCAHCHETYDPWGGDALHHEWGKCLPRLRLVKGDEEGMATRREWRF